MTWIFLHGLGQAPSAWQPVLRRLEPELTVHCPSLSELAADDPRYPALLSALETALDSIPGPLHLCGLSLGGVLAMTTPSAIRSGWPRWCSAVLRSPCPGICCGCRISCSA